MNGTSLLRVSLLLSAVFFQACSGAAENAGTETSAVGASGPVWGDDPCKTLQPTVFDHGGDHKFIGTDGDDVIFGSDGADEIWGNGGHDVICAGGGQDVVHGGAGNDYIDGGGDNDTLYGDEGDDVIHGRGGSDTICGGPGNDSIFGDILDDHLYGDEGDDLLVGGHGTDRIAGGPGDDWMRGDTGNDAFDGGEGHDTVSFATASPDKPESTTRGGVVVDFTDPCVDASGAHHDGCARGDGDDEPLDGIESIVGSPYDDRFVDASGTRTFRGGWGDDTYDVAAGSHVVSGPGPVPAGAPFVYLDDSERDLGLLVVGSSGDDAVVVEAANPVVRVKAAGGGSLRAGPGCQATPSAGTIDCNVAYTLRYVSGFGGDGDDAVTMSGAFPRDATVHWNGGTGDDHLVGGDEEDVLFTGKSGTDVLEGHGGDDALLSESDPSLIVNGHKPDAAHYVDGADTLDGGPGDDQLVADYPCGGHVFIGGPGLDIAGFARSGDYDIVAQLGGPTQDKRPFWGRSFNPALCTLASGTHIEGDLEVLEAAAGNDELWGNDAANVIWGREGNDRIHGLGGDDVLDGLEGDDWLFGGSGNNVLENGEHDFPHAD